MLTGAELTQNFISVEEEKALLTWLHEQDWDCSLKRRVQHFGYKYDYKARTVKASDFIGPLPTKLLFLSKKLTTFGFVEVPNQVIINEYLPGQGIAPHIDCVPCFGPVIASVTLGGGAEMGFTDPTGHGDKEAMYLTPRSLLTLRNEARFNWQHGIAARKSDLVNGVKILRSYRVSLTFRTINPT